MKSIKCEMCNGTDIVKQDGIYVCQSCGTKYSVEEAKKLMIEGSVRIDNSEELKNLYELARRAKDQKNNENAAKYYDMILIKDPSSWEANFFATYFKAMTCKIGEISTAAEKVKKCVRSTLQLIADNIQNAEEKQKAIEDVRVNVINFRNIMTQANKGVFGKIDTNTWVANQASCGPMESYFIFDFRDVFKDDAQVMNPYGVRLLKRFLANDTTTKLTDIEAIIRKYDPSYTQPTPSPSHSSSGGCYVATSVYGSYDCPQVWTLRRYRDYRLAETLYGRIFIRTYYAISPTLVKWFGHTKWFKKMWRGYLDRMVRNLQNEGFESTPYIDREW